MYALRKGLKGWFWGLYLRVSIVVRLRLPRASSQVQMGQEMKEKPKEMGRAQSRNSYLGKLDGSVSGNGIWTDSRQEVLGNGFLGQVGSFVLEGLGNVALEKDMRRFICSQM